MLNINFLKYQVKYLNINGKCLMSMSLTNMEIWNQVNQNTLNYHNKARLEESSKKDRSVLSKQVMTAVLFCVILAVTSLPSIFHHSHSLAVYHGTVSTEFYSEL